MQRYMDVVRQAGDLHKDGQLEHAAFLYETLLGSNPDDGVILYMLGTLFSQQARFGTAITLLNKAVEINPELGAAWHNLGVAYRNEGHMELARDAYRANIALDGDNAETMAMMSGTYVNAGDPNEGVRWADKALKIEPNNPHAQNQKSLCLLELGQFEEAWEYYGNRFNLPTVSCQARPFKCNKWDGGRVKKLAIHGEQGLGDEILFMSCFQDLVDSGQADEIVVECRLTKIFKRSFGVKCYGTYDKLVGAHDDINAYVSMGDLPSFYRKKPGDFPRLPFLRPSKRRVTHYKKRLEKLGSGLKIGIAWHGGTKGTHQELRNPDLQFWKDLMEVCPQHKYISLQYGEHGAPQANELGIVHWKKGVDDLDEFAALVEACDLIISVCQTAIHFAGGLGKECWCLTPSQPAWRYGVEGPMLWYGSVELVRQNGADWSIPFTDIAGRLNVGVST